MPKTKIILGIDPGLATTGYGVIEVNEQESKALAFGTIDTKKNTEFSDRLLIIYQELNKIIKKFKPQAAICEELFFCTNVKTAIAVGQARGVIILTLKKNNLPIYELTPLQIKQTITGYGKAEKKQMQKMVQLILKLKTMPKSDDAADALAIALCGTQIINSSLYEK